MTKHRRALAAVIWLGGVAALTLTPAPGADRRILSACLICGARGSADAVLNVLLFVPLGLFVARHPRAWVRAIVAGLLLSLGIEIIQVFVSGRYSTFGDIVWNTLGSAAGVGLHRLVRARLRGGGRYPGLAGALSAVLSGLLIMVSAWLLEPDPITVPYWGHWAPDFGGMTLYTGELLEARLDGRPIPRGRFPPDRSSHDLLVGDWDLAVLVEHERSAPRSLSPIVSVTDADQGEILLLGANGADLVWRERLRATALRFYQPDLRVPDALEPFSSGDTIRLGVRRVGADRCATVEGVEDCGHELTPGRGWALLLQPVRKGGTHRRALDLAWLLALFLPVGFLSSGWRGVAGNGLAAAVLVGASLLLTDLALGPLREAGAAFAGLLLGWTAARMVSKHHHGRDDSPRRYSST